MTQLILGLLLFLGVHSVSIVNRAWRDHMAMRLGEWPWKGAYGAISLLGLVLIVRGYGAARLEPTVLYVTPAWLDSVGMVLMLVVFPLFVAAYLPGRIQATLKHPMLVAVKTWALAHLLANGTLADVLLFGGFLAWAVADRISMKRRARTNAPQLPASPANDFIAVGLGLAIYAAFVFWLHGALFGVALAG